MLWVLYSLLSAFSWATSDVFTKKASKVDDYILVLSRFLYGVPFVLLLLLFTPIPKLDLVFWIVVSIDIPLEILSFILYTKAIRISPLSLAVPLISLTPVFLVFTSFVILRELPTIAGFFGILLVVVGAYILNLNGLGKGVLEPFKLIFKEKGCVYMMIAAFLFSIDSTLSKILVQKSSPLFYGAIYLVIMAISLLIISFFASKRGI